VIVVMQAAVFCLFKSPLKNVEALRDKHAFASSVYVVDASYCAVYTSGITGSSEEDSVSFPWCFMKSTSVIQYLQHPVATMSA